MMKIPAILNDLLALFFPRLCLLCKEPLTSPEEQICLKCLCDLPQTNFHERSDNPVKQLFIDPVENAEALYYYEKGGKVQKLIHSFKYRGNKELAFLLGKQMALALRNDPAFEDIDALIPVPLHPQKQRKRGYNQSEWLCRGFAAVRNIPIYTDVLLRTATGNTQTRKNLYNRWLNVQDHFKSDNLDAIAGKHILLIDDVITSGSTLSICIKALAEAPGVRISICSLAVAVA